MLTPLEADVEIVQKGWQEIVHSWNKDGEQRIT